MGVPIIVNAFWEIMVESKKKYRKNVGVVGWMRARIPSDWKCILLHLCLSFYFQSAKYVAYLSYKIFPYRKNCKQGYKFYFF